MRLTLVTRPCLITAVLLAVAGCGSASSAQSTAHPTVRITSPASGSVVSTGSGNGTITVRLAISNFTLVAAASGDKPGTGKVWLYENRTLVARLSAPSTTLALVDGSYSLRAVLVTNGKAVASSATTVVSIIAAPNAAMITWFTNGLPAGSSPSGLAVGPDGNIWFTNSVLDPTTNSYTSGAIGRVTPSGIITLFTKGLPPGTIPGMTMARSPDGSLWFTAQTNRGGAIGRVTPSGTITLFTKGLPAGASLGGPVVGPGGNLWFTAQTNRGGAIGRVTPSGTITLFTKGLPAGSSLGGMVAGPEGNIWFETGPTSGWPPILIGIGRITPSGTITLFGKGLIPDGAAMGSMVRGSDGSLWFSVALSDGSGAIGRITSAGDITFTNTSGYQPYQLLLSPGGNPWFRTGGASLGRISPAGVVTTSTKALPFYRIASSIMQTIGHLPSHLVVSRGGYIWCTYGAAFLRITP